MKSYHFDLGNSNTGAIGFSARVKATSKAEALEALGAALSWCGNEVEVRSGNKGNNAIEYITVYFNPDNITVSDIDEWEVCDVPATV